MHTFSINEESHPIHSAISKKKILIVDDEKELIRLVSFHMTIVGYEALSAKDGLEALQICKQNKPDLIILDIMLPRIDGWEVCRRLKQDPQTRNIPIIMLSALAEVNDKLKGFNLGTDDYVTKPFSPRELVVRVKRVLARTETGPPVSPAIKQGMALTEKEKSILSLLVNNAGRVLSHSKILDAVWGQDNVVEYGNIDVHIRHLREKLEKDPENPQFIKTIKGEGYKFEL